MKNVVIQIKRCDNINHLVFVIASLLLFSCPVFSQGVVQHAPPGFDFFGQIFRTEKLIPSIMIPKRWGLDEER